MQAQSQVRGRAPDAIESALVAVFARLVRRPALALAVLVAVTLAAIAPLGQLRVAVDFAGLFGAGTPGAQAIRRHAERFAPLRADEVLLVRAPIFADPDALAAFEDLVLELQFVDGVEQVISLASLPAPGREGAWLTGPELATLEPAARLRLMRTQNPLAAQLLSEDLTAALIAVVPRPGTWGGALASELQQVAGGIEGLQVQLVGLSAVQRAVGDEILHDLWTLTPAAVAICLALLLVVFRDLRALVVIGLPPIVGLVWFFGVLGATGTPLDPLMASLPVVLIVLAFSDSIHVYFAARAAVFGAPEAERPHRLAVALAQTAPAAALTSLTTVIAFASLAFPDSPSLNTMAWAGGVGMVLELLAVLLLMPVLMRLTGAPGVASRPPRRLAAMLPAAQAMARRGGLAVVIAAVVLVGFVALQSRAEIGFRYADYLPQGAEVTQGLADMEALGLGSDRMVLIVETDPADPLARVHAAADAVWGAEAAAWARAEGAGMLARMASRDGTAHALPLQLAIGANGQRADQALGAVEARLAAAGLAESAYLVGPGYALITEGARLVQSLRLGLYATILAVTLLIWVIYRSVRLALAALVVNVIPILGVEGFLVLIGREVTMMNMIALTVAFGIAVDDTLHLLNRLRLAQGTPEARVARALAESGPPMLATTMILLAGLLVTLTSALTGLALYGGLIALAVSLALIADLFLLPGLIRWRMR